MELPNNVKSSVFERYIIYIILPPKANLPIKLDDFIILPMFIIIIKMVVKGIKLFGNYYIRINWTRQSLSRERRGHFCSNEEGSKVCFRCKLWRRL